VTAKGFYKGGNSKNYLVGGNISQKDKRELNMAVRERIKMDDYEFWGWNVSESVGIGGANKIGDVMMIQAMFRYLGMHDRFWVIGVDSLAELPEVNGKYTGKLGRIILNFQKKYDYLLLSVDGLIHPASNQDRNIKFSSGDNNRLMTITLLHTEMLEATDTGIDYTKAALRDFAGLGVWIQ
jgi:hypothetical protein